MVPSIDPVTVLGRTTPDHGDLWALDWDLDLTDDSATAQVHVGGDYTFSRAITAVGPSLDLAYSITSSATEPFPYLWAPHPLMNGHARTRDLLPDGTPVTVGYCSLPDVPPGAILTWGAPVSGTAWVLGEPGSGVALKAFAPMPARAVLQHSSATLTFELDPAATPWLGMWLNYGGWPGPGGDQHIALEPTTAPTDSLRTAVHTGHARILAPGETHRWPMRITPDLKGA